MRIFYIMAVLCLPAVPARADLYGGIEIGGRGVKATVVSVNSDTSGYAVKVVMAKTVNTTLVGRLGETGRFDPEALKETVAAVQQIQQQMLKEYQVPPGHLFVVASSGLFSPLEGKPEAIKANQDQLAAAIRAATMRPLDFLSARRESELSIIGAVPPGQDAVAVLLDIGSGNTKGGYRDGDRLVTVAIPYGSVSFADLVRKRAAESKSSFASQAAELRQEVLVPLLKKEAAAQPGVAKRQRVYLSGGAVWALATLVHPGDRGTFVTLSVQDVETLRQMLLRDPATVPGPDLSGIKDEQARKEAAADVRRVQDTFRPENLLAAVEILRALISEFHLDDRGKTLSFPRYGHLSWLLAYVTEQSRAPK
jgi:exopolyphosphatase/pppGpp-phosphohydrolase